MTTTNTRDKSVPTTKKTSEFISNLDINVKIIYPQNVPEIIRQERINRIYDILTKQNIG